MIEEIYTQDGRELSCIVLSHAASKASIVLFKGTTSNYELMKVDFAYSQSDWNRSAGMTTPSFVDTAGAGILVHQGFSEFYAKLRPRVRRALKAAGNERVYICGQSLGAAIATLYSFDLTSRSDYAPHNVWTVTAGFPRVGNVAFAHHIASVGSPLFSLKNTDDVITQLPWSQTPSLFRC